jgi:hypothetical protein
METKIIPTAKEYLLKTIFPTSFLNKPDEVELWFESTQDYKESVEIMIEFAKLHVQKALEEASENAEMKWVKYTDNDYEIDKDSILKSYPLNNIK